MLERNKIYCMDVLEGLKQLDDESVDLIITSPPYTQMSLFYLISESLYLICSIIVS